jgi:hypothetical protein
LNMEENKSSISNTGTYAEIGEFWDTHDLGDYWDQTEHADFKVDLQSEVTYYRLDAELSAKLGEVARQHGVSPETLVNLWVQEKLGNYL